jgi:hypothetical protein
MPIEMTRSEAEDIAYVLGMVNDFAINIVSTNASVVLLDVKIDIDGRDLLRLGSVVWSDSQEEFVFVPADNK